MPHDPDPILQELKKREPIFHQPEWCSTREALENYAAPVFWEVGASGRVYGREDVLDIVEKRFTEETEPDKVTIGRFDYDALASPLSALGN